MCVNYERSIHAEIAAILNLPKGVNMRRVKLIVVRKNMQLSKPCDNCLKVIISCGIRNICYSCDGELKKYNFNEE